VAPIVEPEHTHDGVAHAFGTFADWFPNTWPNEETDVSAHDPALISPY
jgi:hypothetical protein